MPRFKVLLEAHMRRFEDAFSGHKAGRLTAEEAAELLGISARHFRRQSARFTGEGGAGLDALITGEAPFATLPELMPMLAAAPAGTLCQRITYESI